MPPFPKDAPKRRVVAALHKLGFETHREREHIAMRRRNDDGTWTVLVLPNHDVIKGSTLRSAIQQGGISRDEFVEAYYD